MLEYTCSSVYLCNSAQKFNTGNITGSKPTYKRYALRGVVVSTHTRIWFTMCYSYICQAKVHANETCKMCEENMRACANQNARVKVMQTKDASVRCSCKP